MTMTTEQRLFNIPATPVQYKLEIITYKYNRIFNKIITYIEDLPGVQVQEVPVPGEISKYMLSTKYPGSQDEFIEHIRQSIAIIVKDHFPDNYSFDLRGRSMSLGFTYSFTIKMPGQSSGLMFFHRINEVRKDGTGKPVKQIVKL